MNTKHQKTNCLQRHLLPSLTGRGWGVGLHGVGLHGVGLHGVGLLLLACLTFLSACSSDDDNENSGYTVTTVSEAPAWQVDYSGSESRPDWQEPNASDFENWTVMLVQLEDALKPYASADDIMAFFVYDDLRGLATPAVNVQEGEADAQFYLMKAFGNEAGQEELEVTLKYYCSRLKQVFSRTSHIRYNVGEVYGIDEPLVPQFTLGSLKYPVVTNLTVAADDLQTIDVPFSDGDLLAAFVGDECRGTYQLGHLTTFPITFPVLGRKENEAYTLKYYHAASQRIYTFFDKRSGKAD